MLNGNGTLFYKIDCQRTKKKNNVEGDLSVEKIDLIDEHLKSAGLKLGSNNKYDGEILIDKTRLKNYSWNKLIDQTRRFIAEHMSVYDDLEHIVNETFELSNKRNTLTEGERPNIIRSRIPQQRKYKGKKTDWHKKQRTSNALGKKGEELVMKMQKIKLKGLGLTDESEQVDKMLDGAGYDILSFNEEREKIYIEVKTTTGSSNEPFYMSLNEKEFFEKYPENYYLIRLYNYNFTQDTADYFVLTPEELKGFDFTPISFEVSNVEKP